MLKALKHRLRPRTRWLYFSRLTHVLGLQKSLHFLRNVSDPATGTIHRYHPKYADFPLSVRSGTSDFDVFHQIFAEREYQTLDDLTNVDLVIDCGANVGYSSAYFLSRFPGSMLIAVEPDQANFEMLQANLAPFGTRAICVRAGVWSRTASLTMSETQYRDGRAWSQQVRECNPGEVAKIEAVCIDQLLVLSGRSRISILKMDIEGAEVVVFQENYESWLQKTDVIAIELHEDSMFGNGVDVFHSAIRNKGFALATSGELTICRRESGV